jgi:hypothetical protein
MFKILIWLGISGATVQKLYIRLPFCSQTEVLPMDSGIWMVSVPTHTNGLMKREKCIMLNTISKLIQELKI